MLRGGRGPYLLTAAVMIVLTLAGIALIWGTHLGRGPLSLILTAFAVAQVVLQAVYFMHLKVSRRLFGIFFGAGLVLATFFAWVIGYLVHRMWS